VGVAERLALLELRTSGAIVCEMCRPGGVDVRREHLSVAMLIGAAAVTVNWEVAHAPDGHSRLSE
jgi:hypothetical protein